MRNDMITVVTEPGRGGSPYRNSKGEKKRLFKEGIDSVQHEGMGRRWQRTDPDLRVSRNHRNPLQRFLLKQVGRSWDDVYSEICAQASASSYLGYNLRELVSQEVDVNVTADGDVLRGKYGFQVFNGDLYVCPETNILKIYDDGRKRKRSVWRPHNEFEMLTVDEDHKYVKIDGLWYLVTLTSIPGPEVEKRPFDLVLRQSAFPVDPKARRYQNRFLSVWGRPVYASVKLQANSKESRLIEAALAAGQSIFAQANQARSEGRGKYRRPVTVRR